METEVLEAENENLKKQIGLIQTAINDANLKIFAEPDRWTLVSENGEPTGVEIAQLDSQNQRMHQIVSALEEKIISMENETKVLKKKLRLAKQKANGKIRRIYQICRER